MPKALIDFWSKLETSAGKLYVHPDDLRWAQDNGWDLEREQPATFSSFIKGERFGREDKELHLSLLPVPFGGDLRRAKIFILLMNPGLSSSDYYAEEKEDFRSACVRSLKQTNGDDEFPLFYLNPEFAWSGGFKWWESLLRPILREMMQHEKQFPTYYSALAFLAKRIAVVELVPYHSIDGGAVPAKAWKNLPSARQAIDFVKRLCNSEERPLVLVLRSHERWELETHTDCRCEQCPANRRPTLNHKLSNKSGAAGKAILERLGIS